MNYLKIYTKQDILSLTKIRRFETKLGELVNVAQQGASIEVALQQSAAKFVVLGIPEDIGVKANLGIGGANSSWMSFLESFLNIQSNDFLNGDEVLLLGHLDFTEMDRMIEANAHDAEERINAYRHAVNTIDEAVEPIIKLITQLGKIPVVIGGGHNNSYPCIKGSAKGLARAGAIPIAQINAINLDAHADYRPAEGRHSGNGFRYAEDDGYLQKYCIIGLHENYLSQNVWIDIVNNPFMDCISFEDIFVHGKRTFSQAIAHAISFTNDGFCGIELDLDVITKTLSSAVTPIGISALQARQYINYTVKKTKVAYLHICEGAVVLEDGRRDDSTGKLISYLVTDFIKAFDIHEQNNDQEA